MQDARWPQLKQSLLDRGWTWRDETLHAPHETMSFTTSVACPNLPGFRNRMAVAAETTAPFVDCSVEQADLHEDLVSLVAALDDVLDN